MTKIKREERILIALESKEFHSVVLHGLERMGYISEYDVHGAKCSVADYRDYGGGVDVTVTKSMGGLAEHINDLREALAKIAEMQTGDYNDCAREMQEIASKALGEDK